MLSETEGFTCQGGEVLEPEHLPACRLTLRRRETYNLLNRLSFLNYNRYYRL